MEKKKIGLISAAFLGVSSIIGSGSLFAPYKTAVMAGPAALLTWLVSGGVILLLALCFAELASLYPKRGLAAIIPTLAYNKFFGFPFAIANWLGVVAVIGLEADATVQYCINLLPHLKPYLYANDQLTLTGNMFSILLVAVYCLINYWGVVTLVKANNVLAVLKILIPAVMALVIMAVAFHPANFTLVNGRFIPYGMGSILAPILTSGILVSFNGFQSIVSFSSEIQRPEKTIPLALVISLLFCLMIYLLLQSAFIGAIPSAMLAGGGWQGIQFSAPMVELAGLIGLSTFTSIIYCNAMITPAGSGVTFTGSAGRMFTAMTKNGQMPEFLGKINRVYHVSRRSLLINSGLAILFLLVCRSWNQLAEFLSILHIISYLPIPLALYIFRQTELNREHSFRLWGGRTIALFLFVIFTYLFTLGRLKIITEIFILFFIFQVIFVALNVKTRHEIFSAVKACLGVIIYFSGLWLLTYFSSLHYLAIPFGVVAFYGLTRYQSASSSEARGKPIPLPNLQPIH